MEIVEKRKWISITLLSIVIPIGLLVTFRLTEVLPDPLTISETITADTVYWNMTRPLYHGNVYGSITNVYQDGSFSGSFIICPLSYWENDGMLDYNDGLWFRFLANANTSTGFIYSMNIKSSKTDEYAVLDFVEHFYNWRELNNLAQKNISDGSHSNEALFEAMGIDQPEKCALKLKPLWEFFDQNNADHWITITLEIVYFDGAIYRKVDIPVQLGLIASDNNDSFDAALEIQPGIYSELYLGGHDAKDYYKIYLTKGQRIDVHVNATFSFPCPDLDLYIYDPARELKAAPTDQREYYKTVSFIADCAGYWYIELCIYSNHGVYSLMVSVQK